jgi:CheY-like chemotaxis protein
MSYDVVLLASAGSDTLEIARRIRGRERAGTHAAIVIVADAVSAHEFRPGEGQVDDVIGRPVGRDDVLGILARLRQPGTPSPSGS